jgi:hypothetical protein
MKPIGIIITTALFLVLGIAAPAGAWQDKPDKQQEKDKPAKQEQAAKPERQQRQQQNNASKQQQARGQQDHQQRQQQDNAAKQQQARGQQDQQRQQRQQQDNAAKQQQARGQQDQQRQQRQQQDNAAKQQQARGQQDQQPQQRQQQQAQQSAQRRSPVQVRQQQVAWQGSRAHSWQSEHRTWQQRGGYRGYRVPEDRFRGYYGQDHGFRFSNLQVRYVGGHRRFHYGGYWFGLVDPWPEYWDSDWYDNDDVYVDYYGDGYYLYNRRYPNDHIAISFYLN